MEWERRRFGKSGVEAELEVESPFRILLIAEVEAQFAMLIEAKAFKKLQAIWEQKREQ